MMNQRTNVLTLREFGMKLVEHFAGSGAKPIEIVARTIPPVTAVCPFRHNFCKWARVNVFVNVNYEKAVNRKLEKLGMGPDFEAAERRNGLFYVEDSPFLQHENGTLYLRCMFPKSHGYEYRTLDNQRVIDKDEVTKYLRKSSNRQGLPDANEVRERDYKLENIVAATIAGVHYAIIPDLHGLKIDDLRAAVA